ncbi:MAG: transposase [Planctomycetota bacterium]|nr:MAG: transposase [Planctomycetota bacterium]
MAKKKSYPPKFKFQVVLDALQSATTDAEVARQHGVHPVTLSGWKKYLLAHGHEVFSSRESEKAYERKIEQLERMLGQKEVELALMRNFSSRS